jgi:large subunit ribosomal protein L24
MKVKQKLRKGDNVVVITGKDKGKTGEISKMFPAENKVLISGINVVTKHQKATKASAGGIVKIEAKIDISKIAYCEDGKATKIAFKVDDTGKKVRVAKRTGNVIVDKK